MRTLFVNRRIVVSIFSVMLLIYGVQGISYGQPDAPGVTPGEINTSMVVRFRITLDEGVDENAYQIQLRRKTPQGEWISKCVVIQRGFRLEIAGDPDVSARAMYITGSLFQYGYHSDKTFYIRAIFTDLEHGTTYEGRYRDTNASVCVENPPSPDPWSTIAEGTTHLVAPARAEFVDSNLARKVRWELGLNTVGGHIDLLKIPQASLAKLTELELDDEEITDLTGLEHATGLTDLDLSDNQISDITSLAQLTQLTDLDLSDNQISDISPLAQLTQLIRLDLSENQISDITSLAQLTQLIRLWLWDNQISDISPLVGLPGLKSLSLSSNQISDVTPLTTFASLESLWAITLGGNPITDTSPVRDLKRVHPNLNISINIPVILTDPGDATDLYVVADGSLFQLNLNRIDVQQISHQSLKIRDIAIDGSGGKIYWSTRSRIQRANLDGTHIQNVFAGRGEPGSIALDESGGKIYWMIWDNLQRTSIQRANLDGTDVQNLITGLHEPNSIALDESGGKIYWIDWREDRIQRANLDGTDVQDVITGLNERKSIAIDESGGKIYWATSGTIQRANLDGSDAHIVVLGLEALHSIALDIAGGKIYWITRSSNAIYRANLDGSDVQIVAIGVPTPSAIVLHSIPRRSSHTTERKGDVNSDGTVNVLDLIATASSYGNTGQDPADVNGDGVVDIQDLVLVAGVLDSNAAAPSLYPQSLEMFAAAEVQLWLSQAQQLDLTNPTILKGVLFLEQFLAALLPKETLLLPNYPNPFNPETWIPYRLAEDAFVTLTIYDKTGQVVRTLDVGHRIAAVYESRSKAVYWDGRNDLGEPVASGVYFYHLSAGDHSATRRMVILK